MISRKIFRIRKFTVFLAAILAVLLGLFAVGSFVLGTPPYRGIVTDHFDGKIFYNRGGDIHRSFLHFLEWSWTRRPGPWLEWVNAKPGPRPPDRVEGANLRVTFVNHATVLIQTQGLNILTDPVWSDRIGPFSWLGIKRHRPAGIRYEDLPKIDIVLVSHNHYEHMDLPTLARLAKNHSPQFITGLGNGAILKKAGVQDAKEMDWWEEAEVSHDVSIAYTPARHFSSRGLRDRNRALWGGFVIKTPSGIVYFASDTGWSDHLAQVRNNYGTPRLAILPIGAFLPAWFMQPMHLSPEQAIEAHKLLQAGTSIPVHYGTFRLGDDGQFEAMEMIENELVKDPPLLKSFRILGFGEGIDVP